MPTLEDIADHIGVSRRTVASVLTGGAKPVRQAARRRAERIRALADELGYRPSAAARAMSTGRYNCVAMVLSAASSSRSYLPQAMLASLNLELMRHDMHLVLAHLPDEQLTSQGMVPRILKEWLADGLLINYNEAIPTGMAELIERHHIPATWINVKRPSDCVYADEFDAGQRLTEHLLNRGHRRVAFVDYSHRRERNEPLHYSAVDRPAGYEAAMKAAGLQSRLIWTSPDSYPDGGEPVEFTRSWMQGEDRPEAVVCASSKVASLMYWVGRDVGINVPRDMAMGVFNLLPTLVGEQRVPTAVEPVSDIGFAAGNEVMMRIEAPGRPRPPVTVRCDIVTSADGVGQVESNVTRNRLTAQGVGFNAGVWGDSISDY